jgi:hypothetical protein
MRQAGKCRGRTLSRGPSSPFHYGFGGKRYRRSEEQFTAGPSPGASGAVPRLPLPPTEPVEGRTHSRRHPACSRGVSSGFLGLDKILHRELIANRGSLAALYDHRQYAPGQTGRVGGETDRDAVPSRPPRQQRRGHKPLLSRTDQTKQRSRVMALLLSGV